MSDLYSNPDLWKARAFIEALLRKVGPEFNVTTSHAGKCRLIEEHAQEIVIKKNGAVVEFDAREWFGTQNGGTNRESIGYEDTWGRRLNDVLRLVEANRYTAAWTATSGFADAQNESDEDEEDVMNEAMEAIEILKKEIKELKARKKKKKKDLRSANETIGRLKARMDALQGYDSDLSQDAEA